MLYFVKINFVEKKPLKILMTHPALWRYLSNQILCRIWPHISLRQLATS